jgi:hypothetical protein
MAGIFVKERLLGFFLFTLPSPAGMNEDGDPH